MNAAEGLVERLVGKGIMIIQSLATISDSFRTFLQGGNYEKAILDLMNASSRVFPSIYKHNDMQSRGECDFVSCEETGNNCSKYDVKLPFNKKEGELICSKKGDFLQWINYMLEEVNEFNNCMIKNRGIYNVNELQLYKTIDKRLKTIEKDENVIFFFPFPIVFDDEHAVFMQFAADILSAIYDQLLKEGKVGQRRIYAIYPSMGQKIVLRCLNTYVREYLTSAEISKHISYVFNISSQ
ncbi:MAG: hypothetical protein IJA29_00120 [Lachnospiraceae bacterium]|nr:hypothetical protein [Lachnospiraceae bacterium]